MKVGVVVTLAATLRSPFKKRVVISLKTSVNVYDDIHIGVAIPFDNDDSGEYHRTGINYGVDWINLEWITRSHKEHFMVEFGSEFYMCFAPKVLYWNKFNGQLAATSFTNEATKRHSRLTVRYLSLPISYQHDFCKKSLAYICRPFHN